MKKPIIYSILTLINLFFFAPYTQAQNRTLGIFQNDSLSYNGYTLFTPLRSVNTYLIDNCGNLINRWTSAFQPGLGAYLMEDGNLIRARRIDSPIFNSGGVGGRIDVFDWNSQLVRSVAYNTQTGYQHHDFEVMPNGNLLLIAWRIVSGAEAIAAGRDAFTIDNNMLWPDHLAEIDSFGTVVWKWDSWDHIIQDRDSSKPNFGVVSDHPELIDLNYAELFSSGQPSQYSDWMHCNSVDYNDSLDQIVLSCHNFSEIWIIDHSTTTQEAAGHTGGRYGKGGDLLYRYGNPAAYGRSGNKVFGRQHDAKWIPNDHPHGGKIMVFNNNDPAAGNQSVVEIFDPPQTAPGVYTNPGTSAYGPASSDWSYNTGYRSNILSGASMQPNGNVLFCLGERIGRFIEVTESKQKVWEYVNPVGVMVRPQGAVVDEREVFRAERYEVDFPGFAGKNLSPSGPIELNPLPDSCTLYPNAMPTSTETNHYAPNTLEVNVTAEGVLTVDNRSNESYEAHIFNLSGALIKTVSIEFGKQKIQLTGQNQGLFIVHFFNDQNRHTSATKFYNP